MVVLNVNVKKVGLIIGLYLGSCAPAWSSNLEVMNTYDDFSFDSTRYNFTESGDDSSVSIDNSKIVLTTEVTTEQENQRAQIDVFGAHSDSLGAKVMVRSDSDIANGSPKFFSLHSAFYNTLSDGASSGNVQSQVALGLNTDGSVRGEYCYFDAAWFCNSVPGSLPFDTTISMSIALDRANSRLVFNIGNRIFYREIDGEIFAPRSNFKRIYANTRSGTVGEKIVVDVTQVSTDSFTDNLNLFHPRDNRINAFWDALNYNKQITHESATGRVKYVFKDGGENGRTVMGFRALAEYVSADVELSSTDSEVPSGGVLALLQNSLFNDISDSGNGNGSEGDYTADISLSIRADGSSFASFCLNRISASGSGEKLPVGDSSACLKIDDVVSYDTIHKFGIGFDKLLNRVVYRLDDQFYFAAIPDNTSYFQVANPYNPLAISFRVWGGAKKVTGYLDNLNTVVPLCNGKFNGVIGNHMATVVMADGDVPTAGDDVVVGTEAADTINSLDGHDLICAQGGDDLVNSGSGSDWVLGGDGDDTIYGDAKSDTIFGEDGNDKLYGGSKSDRLYGGNGNDELYGGDKHDLLYGGGGDDRIFGEDGNDRMYGQNGNDYIVGDLGDDWGYGGKGDDYLSGGDGEDRLDGDDTARFPDLSGNDIVLGGNGDDRWLLGGPGNDEVYGQSGNDLIRGNDGADKVYGGPGNDVVKADAGDDLVIDGGNGTDTCKTGGGNNVSPVKCEN